MQSDSRAGGSWGQRFGSLLPGAVSCIQGSHVARSCDQVNDADKGLEQGYGGGDPEAQSEKTHRANCREKAGAMRNET